MSNRKNKVIIVVLTAFICSSVIFADETSIMERLLLSKETNQEQSESNKGMLKSPSRALCPIDVYYSMIPGHIVMQGDYDLTNTYVLI